jgi:hypothetical protein
MSGRQITQPRLVQLILAGMLVSGCSGESETERVVADRVVVAEASPSEAASSTGDSPISPTDALPSEMVGVETVESLPAAEPPDELAAPAEEPPPTTDTPTSTPPAKEPPPAIDRATDAEEEGTPAEGQLVAVADTKPGLTRVGATKCKVCHKVQYASWVESKHADRTPPLDCESCHGSGSEYKKKSIMKDPEIARAAGLVIPEKSFCVGCHQDDWQDDMLERAHAHKEDESG